MKLIDTHAHLYAEQFDTDRPDMVDRALRSGVDKIMLPNIDSDSIAGMLDLESKYPGKIFAMMGLHPCSVKPDDWKEQLVIVKSWLDKRHFVAVGEIGMDLYWDTSTRDIQEQAFLDQCRWAVEKNLPVVIHSREAVDELIALIKQHPIHGLTGIFHCFSGTYEQAIEIISLGFYLGLGGPVTYKKSDLPSALKEVPLDKIVLETDAPYLPPVPYRGKRNESSYILLVAEKLAEIKGLTIAEIAEVTTGTALEIFGLDSK